MGVPGEDDMRKLEIHPWVWAFIVAIAMWVLVFYAISNAQTMSLDRKSTTSAVRDFLGEPSTTYLPDTALVRIVNYAQQMTTVALREKTTMVIDTIVTSVARLRYPLNPSTVDSTIAGRVAMVIQKEPTASGGKEKALAYLPPELVGQTLASTVPSFYTVIEKHLILGESPLGGDTLFVYVNRAGKNLDADTTALRISKEDQAAVIYLSCALVCLRDKQVQQAGFYWQLWQAHTGFKGYPPMQESKSP